MSDKFKFDVVIGNPPYQEETAQKETKNGQKSVTNIFQYFQIEADKIAAEHTVLIYPGGRWIHRSGKGLKNFGLEQINDPKLEKVIFFPNSEEVFQGVGIADGISIVLKDMHKTSNKFEYAYVQNGNENKIMIESPGEELVPLNPADLTIVQKIENTVTKYKFQYLSSGIFPRNLFSIESDFAENNPEKLSLYNGESFDKGKFIKLYTNDKAGKMGRATWFLAEKSVIQANQSLISEWQVVVSSANAGGQKRDNQISIMDNYSAFGRSRVALKSFKTEKEAKNFLNYANSKLIKFAFLMTDEALSSLAKKVPDIIIYTDNNDVLDQAPLMNC